MVDTSEGHVLMGNELRNRRRRLETIFVQWWCWVVQERVDTIPFLANNKTFLSLCHGPISTHSGSSSTSRPIPLSLVVRIRLTEYPSVCRQPTSPPPPPTRLCSGAKKGYVDIDKKTTSPWANTTVPSWVPTTLCYGSSEFNLYQWIRTPPLVYLSVNQLLARPNWCQCDTPTCPRRKLSPASIRVLPFVGCLPIALTRNKAN